MGGVMTMKKMWNNLNIATKLILVFSMVSVMPLLVMSFVLYHISANSLESAMEETASIFSSQIASDMNGFISDYDALTKSLLVNEGLMDRLDTEIPISQRIENKLFYRELVMRLMTMESEIQSVTIMNEEGGYFVKRKSYVSTEADQVFNLDYAALEYLYFAYKAILEKE
jgi:two-component system sensor histidine kinase YesM